MCRQEQCSVNAKERERHEEGGMKIDKDKKIIEQTLSVCSAHPSPDVCLCVSVS